MHEKFYFACNLSLMLCPALEWKVAYNALKLNREWTIEWETFNKLSCSMEECEALRTRMANVSAVPSISRPSLAKTTLSSSSCVSTRLKMCRLWRREHERWRSTWVQRSPAAIWRTNTTAWFTTVFSGRRGSRGLVCSAPWSRHELRTTSRTTPWVSRHSSKCSSASLACSVNRRKSTLSRVSEHVADTCAITSDAPIGLIYQLLCQYSATASVFTVWIFPVPSDAKEALCISMERSSESFF